jgi:ribosomal protein L11 methyltransferase
VRYIELTVRIPAAEAEAVAEVLRDVTESGVSIEHAFTQPDLDDGPETSLTELTAVRAYLPADMDRGDIVLAARGALTRAGVLSELEVCAVADEDWAEAWKEHFHVERYGERIVVAPSWRTYEPRPGDVVLTLDPGMAFGTGQHETTRMCLEALERAVKPGASVLDVGCGSGILSIAAAKLGASRVIALDIDPVCVEVTLQNSAINGVAVAVAKGSLGDDRADELVQAGAFDVLVANIIAGTIIELTPQIAAALAPQGRLIASGIIASREDSVVEALDQAGLRIESSRAMGEWRCIEAAQDQ